MSTYGFPHAEFKRMRAQAEATLLAAEPDSELLLTSRNGQCMRFRRFGDTSYVAYHLLTDAHQAPQNPALLMVDSATTQNGCVPATTKGRKAVAV